MAESPANDTDKAGVAWLARASVLVVAGCLALGFGWFGISQYVSSPANTQLGRNWWDVLYYDLQLFFLGSEVTSSALPYNPWLEAGRFLAAAVTVSGIAFALGGWFGRRLRQFARRRSAGHAVVIGDSLVAAEIVGQLRRTGKVLTTRDATEAALRSVGVQRAKSIYVCADDSADSSTNVAIMRLALGLARESANVFTMITDARLALVLRARRLVKADDQTHPVRIFSPDELAARQQVRKAPFTEDGDPHLLIVGASTFGTALIVEFAKAWREAGMAGSIVTLVDENAKRAVSEIAQRWPFVTDVCRVDAVDKPLETAMLELTVPPTRSYFCYDDEDLALRSALTAAVRWSPRRGSVVVRLNRLTRHQQAFSSDLFDDLGGALDVVSVATSAAEEVMAAEDMGWTFARRIHEAYVKDRAERGENPATNASMVAWDDLPDDLKASNLAQARNFRAKLSLIECTVAPRSRLADPFIFGSGDVERLARAEHERWVAERTAAGWTHAPTRDNKKKHHPLLVQWDKLDNAVREENRDIVREFPLRYDDVLALEGLQLVRLAARPASGPAQASLRATLPRDVLERLAQAIHARYLADERAKGTVMGTGALVPWERLDPTYQKSNLDQARDIGAKLDLIGAMPGPERPEAGFQFTDAEVEAMAVHEHERWRRERVAAGWRYGAIRDNLAQRHPALVPWPVLSEAERERDREAVRALPDLLEQAGYYLTRPDRERLAERG